MKFPGPYTRNLLFTGKGGVGRLQSRVQPP